MRKLVLIIIAFIAAVTFIRTFNGSAGSPLAVSGGNETLETN